ncbi:MAG: helix-turn-helix domain-containing protein [Candidatus Melainabacteria bacterium]|nr:helix-turn-helix domain-containing protein [Candidatus Melainabacteria bacterium]
MYLDQISKKFKSLRNLPYWLKQFLPVEDQIRMIRTALGITQSQLAKKLSFSSNVPIAKLENKEKENPTIETLKKYAQALQCELLIRLIPKKEIKNLLKELAEKKAKEIVNISVANSAMELQKPDKKVIKEEVKRVKNEILEKRKSRLWED